MDATEIKTPENVSLENAEKKTLRIKVSDKNSVEIIEENNKVILTENQLNKWLQIAQSEYFNFVEKSKNLKERTNWILVSVMLLFVFFCEIIDFNKLKEMDIISKITCFYVFAFIIIFLFRILYLIIKIINATIEPSFNLKYLEENEMKSTETLELIEHYKKCCVKYNDFNNNLAKKVRKLMPLFVYFVVLILVFVILNKL
jgi:hypothetical protein